MVDTLNPDAEDPPDQSMATSELIGVVGDVASAFLANPSNRVAIGEIPDVIGNIAKSLRAIQSSDGTGPRAAGDGALVPAVPLKKSVLPDAIICLECGQKFKTMKRHLEAVHDLRPDQYREKWALPADYPLVAPKHAAHRSQLAKQMGLGAQRLPDPPLPPGEPEKSAGGGKAPVRGKAVRGKGVHREAGRAS